MEKDAKIRTDRQSTKSKKRHLKGIVLWGPENFSDRGIACVGRKRAPDDKIVSWKDQVMDNAKCSILKQIRYISALDQGNRNTSIWTG